MEIAADGTTQCLDFLLHGGDDVVVGLALIDAATENKLDLTDRTFAASIKPEIAPKFEVTLTRARSSPDPGFDDTVVLNFSSAQTAALSTGNAGWELVETTGGVVGTLIAGGVVTNPGLMIQ